MYISASVLNISAFTGRYIHQWFNQHKYHVLLDLRNGAHANSLLVVHLFNMQIRISKTFRVHINLLKNTTHLTSSLYCYRCMYYILTHTHWSKTTLSLYKICQCSSYNSKESLFKTIYSTLSVSLKSEMSLNPSDVYQGT